MSKDVLKEGEWVNLSLIQIPDKPGALYLRNYKYRGKRTPRKMKKRLKKMFFPYAKSLKIIYT